MTAPMLKPVTLNHKSSVNQLATGNAAADMVTLFIDEDSIDAGRIVESGLISIDQELGGIVAELVALGDFTGKWLQTSTSLLKQCNFAKRIILLGAGKKNDRSPARARELGMKIGEYALDKKIRNIALVSASRHTQDIKNLAQAAIGVSLGIYKYPALNMTAEAKAETETPLQITVVSKETLTAELLSETRALIDATNFCRYLQDSPPNIATPAAIAKHAAERAQAIGLKTSIKGRAELEKLGFGAMLAVGSGSAHEPQFVVVEYSPAQFKKTVAFVGKGLTMDTGGYSLKSPSTHQVGMQYDMSGAAIALSSVLAIAEQKLPVKVFAIAALVENMVDAHAYRVNDVLKTYSGKTVEIRNTDAEGRVVLCDALSYTAKELKPDYIFEYSTLTGAIVVALGNYGAGLFSFPDNGPAEIVKAASEETGERVWQMPVWEEAINDIKTSPVADLTNIGATAGSAGSSTAAAYLFEFVEQVPFAHIDVAGVAFGNNALGNPRKTGSGYGVQLTYAIAKKLSQ